MQLISSLLASCQIETACESDSDTSSVEVLKALTSHMSTGASPLNDDRQQHDATAAQDPTMAFFDKMVTISTPAESNVKNDDSNIDHLEKMISTEENYFAFILLKCLQLCPSIFSKRIYEVPFNPHTPVFLLHLIYVHFHFQFILRQTTNTSRHHPVRKQSDTKSLDPNWCYTRTCCAVVV